MIGFALSWDGQEHGVLWISGDAVLYDGVQTRAHRCVRDIRRRFRWLPVGVGVEIAA